MRRLLLTSTLFGVDPTHRRKARFSPKVQPNGNQAYFPDDKQIPAQEEKTAIFGKIHINANLLRQIHGGGKYYIRDEGI